MQSIALSWQQAGLLAGAVFAGSLVLARHHSSRIRHLAPFAREVAVIAGLYALWQLAGQVSVMGVDGALRRGQQLLDLEAWLHLPSERSMQQAILGNHVVVQAANLYYDLMHFAMLFVFLFWLFLRHREHYRPVRTSIALTTLACLLIQLVPVAPPRMLPGFVDTAAQYGQSVYTGTFGADELSAMPSVHVVWAVAVGWFAVRLGTSAWRWLGAAHAVLTTLAVVVTANHYWLDGVVGVLVLIVCTWTQGRVRGYLGARRVAPAEPVAVAG